MTTFRAIRFVLWGLVGVAIIGFAAVLYLRDRSPGSLSSTPGASTLGTVTIGGPFALTDQAGRTVTEADLKGHPSLIFFGYTFCPDVCPTALADASAWLKDLGPDADRVKVYFVTVDPERDTVAQMASYLTAFDPRITGLTGTREAVAGMLSAYHVVYRKVQQDAGPYLMDHSTAFYVLDSEGSWTGVIRQDDTPEEAIAKVRQAIAEA